MTTTQNAKPISTKPAPFRGLMRDGSTALITATEREDRERIISFFSELSAESLRKRFISSAFPAEDLIQQTCNSSNPHEALSLIATVPATTGDKVVGLGSYFRSGEDSAEISFAISDSCQGHGLGTLLLEQLAIAAVHNHVQKFWAITQSDNTAMIDILTHSGFTVRENTEHGDVEMELNLKFTEDAKTKMESRERIATVASLRPFFHPRSIVVIGASRDLSSIGSRVLGSIINNDFQGLVCAVNPHMNEILGVKCYESVKDLPHPFDLAIIVVPCDKVLEVVDGCAAKSIRSVVVISAGFAEASEQGRQLQNRLREKIIQAGMRLIGPNCMGLFNSDPDVRLSATFSQYLPPHGNIAMMSQSGALGLAVLEVARRTNLGMSMFVSVGNKADISGNDLLQYWETDPKAAAILLYLESFGNPRKFARIARRVSRSKPIVAIKSGRSLAGQRAAGSHTAALAASTTAADALFEQCGIIHVHDLEEMFNVAQALGCQTLPRGRRVGILTNAGGPGILCVDACEMDGLSVPEFSSATQEKLARYLPMAASTKNPIDMIASAIPDHFEKAIETVVTSGEVDSLIVIYVPVIPELSKQSMDAIANAVAKTRHTSLVPIPVFACVMSEVLARRKFYEGEDRIPTYLFPEAPAHVVAKLCKYHEWRDTPAGELPEFTDIDFDTIADICQNAIRQDGPGWLSAADARALLQAAMLPVALGGIAKTELEAVAIAEQIGFPVAVKLASRTIVHKSDIGGVKLNLIGADQVRLAFAEIRDQVQKTGNPEAMDGVIVQPMLSSGSEVMIGVTNDPLFGPLIAFGLGGVHVEILRDIIFKVTPITTIDANEMVKSIRGYPLLTGFRGHSPTDTNAIVALLLRISTLVQSIPEITELDLNPVLADRNGCTILDARIRVGKC